MFDRCWRSYGPRGHYTGDYCLAAPWQRRVVHLVGHAPISTSPGGRPKAWGLQLGDGARCTLVGGATSTYHGKLLSFYCGQNRWLVGRPDHSHPVWTIMLVTQTRHGPRHAHLVRITHAWLGLPNPGSNCC